MLVSLISASVISLGLSSVYGVALDRTSESPTNDSHSGTDSLVSVPFTPPPNTTLSHASRSHTALTPDNLPPIANPKPGYANFKRTPTPSSDDALDSAPTPAPTGDRSPSTTVHITDEGDFALLLPKAPHGTSDTPRRGLILITTPMPSISLEIGLTLDSAIRQSYQLLIYIIEPISDAESDGVAYCFKTGCSKRFPEGLIAGAAVKKAEDGSWIQVSGHKFSSHLHSLCTYPPFRLSIWNQICLCV
jgi:hypothetical protein